MYSWPFTTQAGTVQDYLYADFFFFSINTLEIFLEISDNLKKLTDELPSLEI